MLRRMSSEEFQEWREYYEIEPFGYRRLELIAGSVASPLFNLWCEAIRGKTGLTKIAHWVLDFGRKKSEDAPKKSSQTVEQMKGIFRAIARAGKKGKGAACRTSKKKA